MAESTVTEYSLAYFRMHEIAVDEFTMIEFIILFNIAKFYLRIFLIDHSIFVSMFCLPTIAYKNSKNL